MKLKNRDEVDLLIYGATQSAALDAAIETGLLWRLAATPMHAHEIVQALNIPGKRGYYWLQVLNQMGILENDTNGYAPSPLAREAILDVHSQAMWQHLTVPYESERATSVRNLPLFLNEPGSIWTAQGLAEPKNYVDGMRANPVQAREFCRLLFQLHQNLANQIVELTDLTDVERMMDLGGGSGVVSMALLRKYPALTSTVVDIENVCVAGREIAQEQGLSNRIAYYPADFFNSEFPGDFDLVLHCDVSVFDVVLFQKIWGALRPGGRFIFVDPLSPTEDSAPPTRAEWVLFDSLRDPNYSIPTLDQVRARLADVGFDVSSDHQTFGNGWVILQAQKKGTAQQSR